MGYIPRNQNKGFRLLYLILFSVVVAGYMYFLPDKAFGGITKNQDEMRVYDVVKKLDTGPSSVPEIEMKTSIYCR